MSPLEKPARKMIDAHLVAAGWSVQGYKVVNFSAKPGIALGESVLEKAPRSLPRFRFYRARLHKRAFGMSSFVSVPIPEQAAA